MRLAKLGRDGLPGNLRRVAVTAQVAQRHMAQRAVGQRLDRIGRGVVGEMTVTAHDALLDGPRAAGILLQQVQVVVGLEE